MSSWVTKVADRVWLVSSVLPQSSLPIQSKAAISIYARVAPGNWEAEMPHTSCCLQ